MWAAETIQKIIKLGIDAIMDKDIIGNLTTIIKILIMTFGPAIAVYIGVKPDVVITFLTACLTFGLACLDAKYPNTIFTNTNPSTIAAATDGILNDEYTLPIDEGGYTDDE